MKLRARDLGLPFKGEPGPLNAITDISGLTVGFCTLTDPARGLRTGVTAILPRPGSDPQPVWAGHYALNGNGEMTGTHWINDAGYFLGPVLITNTHGVGAAHLGATEWMIRHYADYFAKEHAWAMPVVAGLALRQLAKRAALGVGRGGTPGGNNSGDIFLALSTANPGPMPQFAPALALRPELNIELLDDLYLAAVRSVEEAVVNALVAGEDVATFKPRGHICRAIDTGRLQALFA